MSDHGELFGIFYCKKSAKRSNKFWSDIMIHHPLVKEMSILGSSFLCLYGTYSQESEQGGAAGASSHSLNNNGRNMSNDQ